MKPLDSAIEAVHQLDDLAVRDTILTRLSPLCKLASLFAFLLTLASLGRQDLLRTVILLLLLPVLYRLGKIPWRRPLRQLRPVLLMVGSIGVLNLFWSEGAPVPLGPVAIPAGVAALLVLLLKAMGCVLGAYLLLATTTLEKLAGALQKLPVPQILIVSLLLTWRYLVLLLQEGRRMATAYQLRAPESQGIPWKIGGSLLGLLLLRSLDRAQLVYESMKLRGFTGRFPEGEGTGRMGASLALLAGTLGWCLLCRLYL